MVFVSLRIRGMYGNGQLACVGLVFFLSLSHRVLTVADQNIFFANLRRSPVISL